MNVQLNVPRVRISIQNATQAQVNSMQHDIERIHSGLEKFTMMPFPAELEKFNPFRDQFRAKCSSAFSSDLLDGTSTRPAPLHHAAGAAAIALFDSRNLLYNEKDEIIWKLLINTFSLGSDQGYQRIGGARTRSSRLDQLDFIYNVALGWNCRKLEGNILQTEDGWRYLL